MENLFNGASWIWFTQQDAPDTYGDFTDRFIYDGGKVVCHLSCDSDYTLLVNGTFVSSNQYGDFEHYKIYDSIDITDYLVPGENSIFMTVWHFGIVSFRCRPAKAGLLYTVECDGKALCQSGTHTLCRENPNYLGGYKKTITAMMGQSFLFDATKPTDTPFYNSVIVNKSCKLFPRPIPKSRLLEPVAITLLKNEPDHYLVDLGEECVGLPTLDFDTEVPQKITVAWGEHILDGGVRRNPDNKDFSFEYIAKEGHNTYTNYMLRLGGRYLEVFCEAPIHLNYIGMIPQVYPVESVEKSFENPQHQKIYDLCVKTLRLCLMEHYVDTPWREQCLYAFDARNQMLCGYAAFRDGNSQYARANLLLISHDNRDDGLLSITFPCGSRMAIPSFSLHYVNAVREYIEHTGDVSLALEVYPVVEKIMKVYEANIKDGLMYTFDVDNYWNFYDWSSYMNGRNGVTQIRPDLMVNCLFLLALDSFRVISEKIGRDCKMQAITDSLKIKTKETFFDKERGLFSMNAGGKEFGELGNAMAVLAGLTTAEEGQVIARELLSGNLEACSLSTKCFKYDALLKIDSAYRQNVVEEICQTYQVMLDAGATSVWEVLKGADAFNMAGSLCHGWSTTPILYL